MAKWLNGAGARAYLNSKQIAILDRSARRCFMKYPLRIRAISGGWVRNTRRVRRILEVAYRNARDWRS